MPLAKKNLLSAGVEIASCYSLTQDQKKKRLGPSTILKNTTHTKIPFRILRSGSIKKSESPASEERLD